MLQECILGHRFVLNVTLKLKLAHSCRLTARFLSTHHYSLFIHCQIGLILVNLLLVAHHRLIDQMTSHFLTQRNVLGVIKGSACSWKDSTTSSHIYVMIRVDIASLLIHLLLVCNHRNGTFGSLILIRSGAFVLFPHALSPFASTHRLMSIFVDASTSFSRVLNVHHLLFYVPDGNLVNAFLIVHLGLGSCVLDLRLCFSHAELLRYETIFDDLINVFFLSKTSFSIHVHISHLMT